MKLKLDCIPCFLSQALEALRFTKQDELKQRQVIKKLLKACSKFDLSSPPLEMARLVHGIVRNETGVDDPYREAKIKSNKQALKIVPQLKAKIQKSKDPLNTAVRLAIAGNIIDFGPRGDFELEKAIVRSLKRDFAIDDYREFKRRLETSTNLLYFADNAGEIAFDKLLVKTLLEVGNLDKISFVVKGGPFLNDATIEDTRYVQLNDILKIEIYELTNGDPGSGPVHNSDEVKSWIDEHHLVISKGQGNYEGLSDLEDKHLFFMLMAKCPVIASDLGVDTGEMILKENGPD